MKELLKSFINARLYHPYHFEDDQLDKLVELLEEEMNKKKDTWYNLGYCDALGLDPKDFE